MVGAASGRGCNNNATRDDAGAVTEQRPTVADVQIMESQHVDRVSLLLYCFAAELPRAGRCAEGAAAAAVTTRSHTTAAAAAAAIAALPL
jgi:hypothetical protein